MSLGNTFDQTFEGRLAEYSRSTEEAVKSTLVTSTGYFAGAAALLALGTTEAEAVITITNVNHVLNPASGSSESPWILLDMVRPSLISSFRHTSMKLLLAIAIGSEWGAPLGIE